MLRYIISICFFIAGISITAQETKKEKDTVPYKDRYGIRVGLDVVLPFYTLFSDDKKGFELVGDFRLTNRIYLASELVTGTIPNRKIIIITQQKANI